VLGLVTAFVAMDLKAPARAAAPAERVLHVTDGEAVQTGDLLAELNPLTYQAAVDLVHMKGQRLDALRLVTPCVTDASG
jgi:Biotin-lipoyl like